MSPQPLKVRLLDAKLFKYANFGPQRLNLVILKVKFLRDFQLNWRKIVSVFGSFAVKIQTTFSYNFIGHFIHLRSLTLNQHILSLKFSSR